MSRLGILISGRGSNLDVIAQQVDVGILQGLCKIACVVSNRAAVGGLGIAASHGISAETILSKGKSREEFEQELVLRLQHYGVTHVVLAGFMRVFSPYFISKFAGKIVNIHPADTHAYQGAHGYEWAWEQRLLETKITVHLVDAGVDTGPIVAQATVDLCGVQALEEVVSRGLAIEYRLYSEALRDLLMTTWRL